MRTADNACMRDYEIRQAFRAELTCLCANADPGTLIIDELPICRHSARADLAVIDGHLSGYEIKSERDTLRRLEGQKDAYGRVFDYVTVVATAKHTDGLFRLVPAWWGLTEAILLGGAIRFQEIRQPAANPQQCPLSMCQLLWRAEALDILAARGLAGRMRSQPRRKLWETIAEAVPLHELRQIIAARLKARGHWRVARSRT